MMTTKIGERATTFRLYAIIRFEQYRKFAGTLILTYGDAHKRCSKDRTIMSPLTHLSNLKYLQIDPSLFLGTRVCPQWLGNYPPLILCVKEPLRTCGLAAAKPAKTLPRA